jgi:hypothetical protein
VSLLPPAGLMLKGCLPLFVIEETVNGHFMISKGQIHFRVLRKKYKNNEL